MARRARGTLRGRVKKAFEQLPYGIFKHGFAAHEVLGIEDLQAIHEASMQVLETSGMKIMDCEARNILREGGFEVDDAEERVRFERSGVMELIAKAPDQTSVRGRNPRRRAPIGGGSMAIAAVGGPPFVSDLDGGRRAGNYEDMRSFIKLTHMLNIIHMEGGCSVEPTDLPVQSRHLDFYLSCCELTDKPWKPLSVGRQKARDAIEMAKILYQEDEDDLAADPVFFVNTNTNTPLVLDREISQGIIEFARAGQAICVTPFALSGAMAPTTIAGALALQNAETLAACALVQLVRPACPYIYGAFTCNVDMRTGSPAFGTPEYTLAAQASGQLARHYALPWRSSNTNASNAPDAQAAYESQMSVWGSILGHASVLNQGAGWLEGGLVASYEKLILDAEMLQMMRVWSEGFVVDGESLAVDTVREVGPGGHFFGTAHTLERYEKAFYSPLLSDWSNFENWRDAGSKDATHRANELWKLLLDQYEAPSLDPGIWEELCRYVEKRKEELTP